MLTLADLERVAGDPQPDTRPAATPGPDVVAVLLELIDEPPAERAIRRTADDSHLAALAASLANHGLLQAPALRPTPGGRYEVVFGARRVAAARLAGWTSLACRVFADVDDERAVTLALVENWHRRDLTRLERILAIRRLAELHEPGGSPGGRGAGPGKLLPPPLQPRSSNGLARQLGLSQPTVSRLVALGRDQDLLAEVEAGAVSMSTASFVALAPPEARAGLLEDVKAGRLANTHVRDRVRRARREAGLARAQSTPGPATEIEATLTSVLRILEQLVRISTLAELTIVRDILTQTCRLLGVRPVAAPRGRQLSEVQCLLCGRPRGGADQARCQACGGAWTLGYTGPLGA
jgi:ParB-like chromosome segregation protein Spo0J